MEKREAILLPMPPGHSNSDKTTYEYISGVHTGFFDGGGKSDACKSHAPLGGGWGMLPKKMFDIYML